MEEASQKVPVLLECGHTVSIDESEFDWNGRYYCGICGNDSLIGLRRHPIRKIERVARNKVAALLALLER